ncbi:MAG: DUF5698 domain-containing protein [Bacilli bacterium]|jgi:uncharacterized protein YebE (UPF0316 family)|nr:DUF5698 domain-containing protein [Bacilli bacterium]
MWDSIFGSLNDQPVLKLILECLLIFFARIIEVSMGTLRIILINKGYRKPGVVLAFFEVLMWIFVASQVIAGINEEPIKAIVYSFGFASGVYVGSRIENYLAFGKVLIQVITDTRMGTIITDVMRADGLGVTTIKGTGKDAEKTVIMIYANRKGKDMIVKKIHEIDEHAMIVTNEVSTMGGYFSGYGWRRFTK